MSERPARRDVFISYSSADKKWADAATAVLERQRIRCWVAPRDITPGMEWGAAIIEGIDTSRVMVLIFSGRANASPQVRREVERAISKGLAVVPFRIENVAPAGAMEYALGNTHWLDAFTPPAERQMERLADAVQALLGRPMALPPPPPPVQRTMPRPAQTAARPRTPRDERPAGDRPVSRGSWLIAGVLVALILISGGVGGGLYLAGKFKLHPVDRETAAASDSIVRSIDVKVQDADLQKPGSVTLTHKLGDKVLRNVSMTVTLKHHDLIAEMAALGIDTRFEFNGKALKDHTPPMPTVLKSSVANWTTDQPVRLVIPGGSMSISSVAVVGSAVIDDRPVRIEIEVSIEPSTQGEPDSSSGVTDRIGQPGGIPTAGAPVTQPGGIPTVGAPTTQPLKKKN